MELRGAVPLSHFYLHQWLRPGDHVVDATCGNGQDTLLLARLVGEGGRVWALDIQPQALERTRERLAAADWAAPVQLLQAGHERLAEVVRGPLRAVVFNLGYLPGGDRACVTRPESTVAGLGQAVELLEPGGILLAVVYTGHPGGEAEGPAIAAWAAGLPPRHFHVWEHRQANRPPTAPYLVMVVKGAERRPGQRP